MHLLLMLFKIRLASSCIVTPITGKPDPFVLYLFVSGYCPGGGSGEVTSIAEVLHLLQSGIPINNMPGEVEVINNRTGITYHKT